MYSFYVKNLLIGFLGIVLVACAGGGGSNDPGPQEFAVIDGRERLGAVFQEQTSDIDNSVGTSVLSQDLAAQRDFGHTISLNLNSNSRLNPGEVEDRIYTEYDIDNRTGQKLCVIPVDVPAGQIHRYEIEWTEVVREGTIEEGIDGGGEILGDYEIVTDLRCQVIGLTVVE